MACSLAKTGYPDERMGAGSDGHQIFDTKLGRWRTMTIADRLCWDGKHAPIDELVSTTQPTQPDPTDRPGTTTTVDPVTLQPITVDEFTLGCKVPDHNGPLVEGFAANSKWKSDAVDAENRHKPGVDDGDIDRNDFGEW